MAVSALLVECGTAFPMPLTTSWVSLGFSPRCVLPDVRTGARLTAQTPRATVPLDASVYRIRCTGCWQERPLFRTHAYPDGVVLIGGRTVRAFAWPAGARRARLICCHT